MKTTLNQIRECRPCEGGWKKLLNHLGKYKADDEPLSVLTILNSNGLDDALWCLRAVKGFDREKRLYAVRCARRVQHLTTDQRSLAALDVAERYANGEATQDELAAASADASAAVAAAYSAAHSAASADASAAAAAAHSAASADASAAAYSAAHSAASADASAAAYSAASAAAYAASGAAAYVAAYSAAAAAAYAASGVQEKDLRELLEGFA